GGGAGGGRASQAGDGVSGAVACVGRTDVSLRSLLRVPPPSGNHDTSAGDLAVTRQVFADDIDIIEASVVDGEDGRVSDTAWLEAAELRPLQCERGIDGRGRDHIGKRHTASEELRHADDLI